MPFFIQALKIGKSIKKLKKIREMDKMTKAPARENKAARKRLKKVISDVKRNPRKNELPGVAASRTPNTKTERAGLAVTGAGAGTGAGFGIRKLTKKKK